MMTTLLLGAVLGFTAQDTPQDIEKSKLPKMAECVICTSHGAGHGKEKPVAGVMFRGKAYYFCNTKEVELFKKDPDAFVPPVLPRAMPKFELADTKGEVWNAEDTKDRLLLIDFWATWCGPCKEMKPLLDKSRAKYAERKFEVLSVSIDEKAADLTNFLGKNKFANPVLHDTKQIWADWNVKAIPTFFLVRDGQIVGQHTGTMKQADLDKLIEAHLPPAKP